MNEEIKEIKINKENGSITFINNNICFSQFGIAPEILDLITNLQEKVKLLTTGLKATDKAYKDYKSRCEKAAQYINNLEKDYDINVWQEDKHWAYVLYILTGGDKDRNI